MGGGLFQLSDGGCRFVAHGAIEGCDRLRAKIFGQRRRLFTRTGVQRGKGLRNACLKHAERLTQFLLRAFGQRAAFLGQPGKSAAQPLKPRQRVFGAFGQPRFEPGNRHFSSVNIAAGADEVIRQVAALLSRPQHQFADFHGAQFGAGQRAVSRSDGCWQVFAGRARARLDDFEQPDPAFGEFGQLFFGLGQRRPFVRQLLAEGFKAR